MYGLPSDFDAKFLFERTLEQICFNQNQIALHFDDNISIIVESAFSHDGNQPPSETRVIEVPVSHSDLMQLVGFSVSDASGDKDGTLTLVFDNGHVFRCFDTSPKYESYKIDVRGTTIIV